MVHQILALHKLLLLLLLEEIDIAKEDTGTAWMEW